MSERQATPRPDAETDGDADGSRAGDSRHISFEQRAREMYRLRVQEQLTLKQIGHRFGIGPERTRQILRRYCHTNGITYPTRVKRRTR